MFLKPWKCFMNLRCHCFVLNMERPMKLNSVQPRSGKYTFPIRLLLNKGSGKTILYDPVNHNTRLYKQLLSHQLLGKANLFAFIR